MSIVDKVANEPSTRGEVVPDAPRDPKDRRKRIRSSCYQYASQQNVDNSLKALRLELKLKQEKVVGLGLGPIFLELENHLDRPLKDTWTGVSCH